MRVAGPVGLRIRTLRKSAGLTQAELARRAEISASYLNLIEADKRAVGGKLLQRIASLLDTDLDSLSGVDERRIADRLADMAAHPRLARLALNPGTVNEFISRQPDWARAMLALWRQYEQDQRAIATLTDRAAQDPVVSDAIHDLLNDATAIRSTSEVLDTVDDLTGEQRERFVDIILSRSGNLSRQASHLIDLFEQSSQPDLHAPPEEEVDDFFSANNVWFPTLEVAADNIRDSLGGQHDGISIASLSEALSSRHGIRVETAEATDRQETDALRFDRDSSRLLMLAGAAPTSIRFSLMTALTRLEAPDCAEPLLESDVLTTDDARNRAREALFAWTAAAVLLPYDRFLEDARQLRFDLETLSGQYRASFEQVALRLVSLRRAANPGIPFGLIKIDPSGVVIKRHSLPGLPLPRSSAGCPIWPLYGAFQTPDRIVRQQSQFPGGGRYLQIARTVRHGVAGFHATPFLHAIMLTCDAAYSDRIVYGDRLQSVSETAVGPGCRLCSRDDCRHRGEASAILRQNQ